MPETFDLDDDGYDPLGLEPSKAPPNAATPPSSAPPQAEPGATRATTGAVGSGGQAIPPPEAPPSRPLPGAPPPRSSRPVAGSAPISGTGPLSGPPTVGDTVVSGPPTDPRLNSAAANRTGAPPHSKASDLLRGHPNYKAQDTSEPRTNVPFITAERRITRFDDTARFLLNLAAIVAGLTLIYYFYALFSHQLTFDQFNSVTVDVRQHELGLLDLARVVMTWSLLTLVGVMIFLFYDEPTAAYAMVALFIFLQWAFPFIVSEYLAIVKGVASHGSNQLCQDATQVAWIPGLPGIFLVLVDIARKVISHLEEQKYKRKYLKYGQGVLKADKSHNLFLGYCWSLPFCRENVRVRCPIFLRKRGPCWWTKRGCMCDETIVLAASAGDWKKTTAAAAASIEGPKGKVRVAPPPPNLNQSLSMAFKKERCRQCVIYNLHQEQKYKALVFLSFAAVAAAFYLYHGQLLDLVAFGYKHFDKLAQYLAFGGHPAATTAVDSATSSAGGTTVQVAGTNADLSGPVGWAVLIIVTMLVLSKVLQLVEYVCFKLKI